MRGLFPLHACFRGDSKLQEHSAQLAVLPRLFPEPLAVFHSLFLHVLRQDTYQNLSAKMRRGQVESSKILKDVIWLCGEELPLRASFESGHRALASALPIEHEVQTGADRVVLALP